MRPRIKIGDQTFRTSFFLSTIIIKIIYFVCDNPYGSHSHSSGPHSLAKGQNCHFMHSNWTISSTVNLPVGVVLLHSLLSPLFSPNGRVAPHVTTKARDNNKISSFLFFNLNADHGLIAPEQSCPSDQEPPHNRRWPIGDGYFTILMWDPSRRRGGHTYYIN